MSSEFPKNLVSAERLFLGTKVILCTLSMMSHEDLLMFSTLIPVNNVIIDEASQIYLADYVPLLDRFSHSLKKLVLIGDDKQRERCSTIQKRELF